MANDHPEPLEASNPPGWTFLRSVLRAAAHTRAAGGQYVAPLLYVPAAISGNRLFLAIIAGAWTISQLLFGVVILIGDEPDDPRPSGVAFWQALAGLVVGAAPWLVLPFAWTSLTTGGLLLLVPALAVWGVASLIWSAGEGASLGDRIMTSPLRILAPVMGGLWAFAAFVVGLVLLIKAAHPLR